MSHGNFLLWNSKVFWEDLYHDKEFRLVNGSDHGFTVTSGAQCDGKHDRMVVTNRHILDVSRK